MKKEFPKAKNWIPVYGIIKAWDDNKIHPLSMMALINYNALIFFLIVGFALKIYLKL